MFNIETIRLIKQTFNRFFAILMIVLIGTSFMMGLLSARPIMETNVDEYQDRYNFQDLQVYSSYGFNDKDVEAIEGLEYVEQVFPSRQVDGLSDIDNGLSSVVRLEELDRSINQLEVKKGRLPEKEDEIALVYESVDNSIYEVGSEIHVYLEDEDILDYITHDTFKVVGIVRSPAYMSKILGTSNYRNKTLSLVGYTLNSNFLTDYYTTLYIRLKDTKEMDGFSNEYYEYTDDLQGSFTVFAKKQQEVLKQEIIDKYTREIKSGEMELERNRQKGQEQLDEAKLKLDDANIQIIAAEGELASLKQVLETAISRQKALEKQYSNNSYQEIEKIEKQYGKSFNVLYTEVLKDYGTYNALKNMSGAGSSSITDSINRIRDSISQDNSELKKLRSRVDELQKQLISAVSEEDIDRISEEITDLSIRMAEIEGRISVNTQLLNELLEMQKQSSGSDIEKSMKDIDAKYNGSVEETFSRLTKLQEQKIIYDTLQYEISVAKAAISKANSEIRKIQQKISSGKKEYEKGLEEYNKALIDFNIEIEKAESEIKKAYQDLNELPAAQWIILGRKSHYSHYMYSENAKQMGGIGYGLPVLFFMVAALVCVTTMSRLIDEQRGQIGIFSALGYSKFQIKMKYILYVLLATVIGSVIGIVSGLFLFPTVIYEAWKLLYDIPDVRLFFPLQNIIICFVSFTVLMTFVTYLVCNRSLKEVPSQLLRPKAPKNAKRLFIERIKPVWNLFSLTGKITIRNIIRYKVRFFMTVIGIAGCTALLVVGFGVKNSVEQVVSNQFGEIFNHNYTVTIENDKNLDEMVSILRGNLDNEYVSPYMNYSTKVYFENSEDKTSNVIVIDAREANDVFKLKKSDTKESMRLSNSGVIVSQKFAESNHIEKGDFILIESKNGIKEQVKVSGICEMYFQHYIFISDEYYRSVFEETEHMNTIAVKNEVSPEFYKDIENVDGYLSVIDFTSLTQQFNTMITSLNFIILVIIITAASLAFVVLINLTQVNISERLRELATLKVLGFRNHEVNSYIFKEMFFLSIIGALCGLPLGKVFHTFIMGLLNMEMIMFSMNIKFLSYLISFGITVVFTVLVMLFTLRSLKKIKMVESLKSVE